MILSGSPFFLWVMNYLSGPIRLFSLDNGPSGTLTNSIFMAGTSVKGQCLSMFFGIFGMLGKLWFVLEAKGSLIRLSGF
jgi:hypothetical protein